jgi:hypothetical protein
LNWAVNSKDFTPCKAGCPITCAPVLFDFFPCLTYNLA